LLKTFIGQLYILDTRLSGSETLRILAILHALHRAIITSPTSLPDIEFSFSTSDIADPNHLQKTIWALSRTSDEVEKWVMSGFGFWCWPLNLVGGYEQIQQEIADTELEFHMKKKQAVWRGVLKTNEHRKDLLRVTREKEWADVKAIEWSSAADPTVSDGSQPISMAEHCQYQFMIHTEGTRYPMSTVTSDGIQNLQFSNPISICPESTHPFGEGRAFRLYQLFSIARIPVIITSYELTIIIGRSYSGRGTYLQNCNSAVIMPKRAWIEPHHALLVSSGHKQNFLEVEQDFSDLEKKVLDLLQDQERAQLIAQNSIETFRDRYLTPAAQAYYWRQMIMSWA
jgi:hypothetical protein